MPLESPGTTPGPHVSPIRVARDHTRVTCQCHPGLLTLPPDHMSALSLSPGTTPRGRVSPSWSPGIDPGPHVSTIRIAQHHHQAACQPHQSHPAPPPGRVSAPLESPGTTLRSHVNPSGSPSTTPGPHVSPVGVARQHRRATCQPRLGLLALAPVHKSTASGSPGTAPGPRLSAVGIARP